MAPTWEEQIAQIKPGMSRSGQIATMNSIVTPCSDPKKHWWQFWIKRHDWEDITLCLNTVTYTTADRCRRCGLTMLSSGI
jgi:hypothetical protein